VKKKPTKKETPMPEYDSQRQQNVLLEKIGSDVKTVAEGHSAVIRKLDVIENRLDKIDNKLEEHDKHFYNIESELNSVQAAVNEIDKRTTQIGQKLDTVTQDHEERLKKLEAVS
jgi:archaellum component FlaC